MRPAAPPLPGTRVAIPLTADAAPVGPGDDDLRASADHAEVRVIAAPRRDLAHDRVLAPALQPVADALLVDVRVAGKLVLPGAWVQPEVIERGTPLSPRTVRAEDLRPPAVVLGDGSQAVLAWGETVWPLGLDGNGPTVAIPASARPDPHPLSRLRRLLLVATGRRERVGVTLWRQPDFEVPWQDVRLLRQAAWWFEIAQVPRGMRYAEAEAHQGVGRARRR